MSTFTDRSLRLAIKLVDAYVEHLHHKNKLIELEIALKRAELKRAELKRAELKRAELKRAEKEYLEEKNNILLNKYLNSATNKVSHTID